MGIFNIIQQKNERRLSLLLRFIQNILYLRIGIGRRTGYDPLMFSGFGHLVETFFCHIFDYCAFLRCLSLYGKNGAVLTPVKYEQLVYRFTGAKCFQNGIPSFYCKFGV